MDSRALLNAVAGHAADWLDDLPHRPVRPDRTPAEFSVTDTLGDAPVPVEQVIDELVREASPD